MSSNHHTQTFTTSACAASSSNGTNGTNTLMVSTANNAYEEDTNSYYMAAIDQGTTSSRFIVFDLKGRIVAMHQTEFDQIYPKSGWVEHDPMRILESVNTCINATVEKMMKNGLNPSLIKSIGITNQRETTVSWDNQTGKPLHHAIVWLDTRTKEIVDDISSNTDSEILKNVKQKSGLPISTYFSALKMKWLLDNISSVTKAAQQRRLSLGTVDSWLIYKLTGNKVFATDVSNASRTMLMNIHTGNWDKELCDFFSIPKESLPQIHSSAQVFGYMADGPLKDVPISGCLGDQQAALVGQRCFSPGSAKNTYGTGCFMLFNTGTTPVISNHGLLTTVGYQLGPNAPIHYCLEGSIAIAGAAVKWLRDNLGIIKQTSEVNDLASQVSDTAGVYFVPAFSGLFAPYWRDDARGCILGMTQYTTKSHIARAALESVCFQTKEILAAMNKDSGHPLMALKVDGGLTNSDLCMQIQADIIGINVDRPKMRETTALGAALASAVGAGTIELIQDFHPEEGYDIFNTQISVDEASERFNWWRKAVEKSLGWLS